MSKSAALSTYQKVIYNCDKFIGGSVCNICLSTMFSEKYSANEIQNAILNVFKLNEALRIRIKDENGEIIQYLTDFCPSKVEILQFENREELEKYGEKLARKPIDINGQLSEIIPFALPDNAGVIIKLHHIVGDAWSVFLIGLQLSKTLRGEPFETYSFFDSLKNEALYRSGKRYEQDRAYYEEEFLKSGETIFLSDKKPSSFKAKRVKFGIDYEKTKILSKYAKEHGSALFNLFATAYSVYFSRIKMNAKYFNIGVTVLNRNGAVERNTMGDFVNTVPFFIGLDSGATFSKNLASVDDVALKIMRHQRFPYDELLEDLKSKFNLQGRLFDCMIDYQNAMTANCAETKIYFQGMQAEHLMIHIVDYNDTGKIELQYDYLAEIFTEKEMNQIHSGVMLLLEDAIKNRDKKIGDLNIAPEDELSILRGELSILPKSATIPSLFEETVTRKRNEICIFADDKNRTFAEFNSAVKVLDSKIRKITCGKKGAVAVIAERSIEMYVAAYAVMRGGNSYLPIDPSTPIERIGYMLENSGAQLVCVQDKFCALLDKIKVLNISEIIKNGNCESEDLPVLANPEDSAYIIYTSGSTGKPKGASISHKSLLNRILWMEKKYPLNDKSVILQKTPFTFDVSLWEIFRWGISEGKMAFMKPSEHFLPEKITDEIYNKKVTTIHLVPSVFDLFVNYLEKDSAQREKISTLKDIFLSGEVLPASLVNKFYKMFSAEKVKIHNLYGPTECAIDVTFYDCETQESDPLPIGAPIDNTDIFILDNNMKLLPKGVIGEICVGGANVGQGYSNNEKLTAEVFQKNPFGTGSLYKTGDLGYINCENKIIFCGRKDIQIKLGGQRVEPEEVEKALSQIDGITLSAVVARKNNEGNQILCAFYSGEKKSAGKIRNELGKKLQRYMIPQIIIYLDKMPLTSNGKIDRKSLPEIDFKSISPEKEFVEAKTETEIMVCDKFSEILHISPVSMDTDFFLSGGSSIDVLFFLSDERFSGISAFEFIADSTPAGICALLKNKKINKYKYLHPLFVSEKSERTLLLFPYAGGNAESYSKLTLKLKKELPSVAIYFLPFLHSREECEAAFEEIRDLGKIENLYFYAHCIGYSIALQIIDFIEENSKSIGGLFVGGNIPPKKPYSYNWWNIVPDFILKKILIKAGSKIGDLSTKQTHDLLRHFRKDCDFFINFFKKRTRKIFSPLSVIINKNDIFTKNHKETAENWGKYSKNEVSIRYIESDSHYFQSKNADILAKMIAETILENKRTR